MFSRLTLSAKFCRFKQTTPHRIVVTQTVEHNEWMGDTELERSGVNSEVSKVVHVSYSDPSVQLSEEDNGNVYLDPLGADPLGYHDVEKKRKMEVWDGLGSKMPATPYSSSDP